MSKFIRFLEQHKYGVFAAFLVNVGIFIYLQIPQIKFEYEISPYILEASLEIPENEIELNPDFEIIKAQNQSFENVKNASRDIHDDRPQSDKDYSSIKSEHNNKSLSQVEKSVYDMEKQFFEEAGGSSKRDEIKKQTEIKKKEIQDAADKNNKQNQNSSAGGSTNAPKGDVLVQTDLKGRTNQYIPAPGYMCDRGAIGKIAIKIRVDESGKVVDARVDPSSSSSSNSCMISYALEFARKSKFNYSASVSSQEGYIYYTYVYQ